MSTYSKGCLGRVFGMLSAMLVALSMLGALAAAQDQPTPKVELSADLLSVSRADSERHPSARNVSSKQPPGIESSRGRGVSWMDGRALMIGAIFAIPWNNWRNFCIRFMFAFRYNPLPWGTP